MVRLMLIALCWHTFGFWPTALLAIVGIVIDIASLP